MVLRHFTTEIAALPGSTFLCHNGSLSPDPLNPLTKALKELTKKRNKVDIDHLKVYSLELILGLYTSGHPYRNPEDPDYPGVAILADEVRLMGDWGHLILPLSLVRGALLNAAAKVKLKSTMAPVLQFGLLEEKEPLMLVDGEPLLIKDLYANKKYWFSTPMKVQASTVIRTRAEIPNWSTKFSISLDDSFIEPEAVFTALDLAGKIVGVGDSRTRGYGRFKVLSFEESEGKVV